MRILIVTPTAADSRSGNRITANRWAGILRKLGHRVQIRSSFSGELADCLIALHAQRSAASVRRFHAACSLKPIVLALTGTDLYRDIKSKPAARRSLQLATRLVVLQQDALHWIPGPLQRKTVVIYQSAMAPRSRAVPRKRFYDVAVVGHLRAVKDPFRAAIAVRRLPSHSRIRIIHCGAALSETVRDRALREMQSNARYHWLGNLTHGRALRLLDRSRLLVSSSRIEGASNTIGEALATHVPTVSSRISGAVGMLGKDYHGFFDYGDTAGLRQLLLRAETDTAFYETLQEQCRQRAPLVEPQREFQEWATLIRELEIG
ncbi:MAG: TIGR04348 family glycosyltransferase [Planctomycetaceae bacterium]|nr:TIGR04348 family glycosyltransferase [Planctomycetaceae bacterium]MBP62187.1 TIGR04348 family glycosyltransferase [Planctomycetaceae bacterium]